MVPVHQVSQQVATFLVSSGVHFNAGEEDERASDEAVR